MFISKIRAVARFIFQLWPLVMVVGLAQTAMLAFDWSQPSRPLIHPWFHAVVMTLLIGIPSALALRQTGTRFRQGEQASPWLAISAIALLLAVPASSGQSLFSAAAVGWYAIGFIWAIFLKALWAEWLSCEHLKVQSRLLTELDERFARMESRTKRSSPD